MYRGWKDNNPLPDYEQLFRESGDQKKKGSAKILMKIYKSNALQIFLSLVLFIIKACPIWIIPLVTSYMINLVTEGGEGTVRHMTIIIVILFLLILQNIPSHVLYARYTDKMLRRISGGFRSTLIRKLQHLSVTYHKEIETGKIQAKFVRDIEAIEFLNNQIVKNVVPIILELFIYIGITISKSVTVTLFFLCVIPINVLLVYVFRKNMRYHNSVFRKENEHISAKLSNMLEMLPLTKAHGLEDEEIESLQKDINTLKDKGLAIDRTNAYFGSWSWVMARSLSALCLLFTSILAFNKKIAVGDIVLYQSYFSSITGYVQNLLNIYPQITKGFDSLSSVSEIMLSDDIEDNRGKIRLRYVHGTVHFDNVSYSYPNTEKKVIDNLTLHVEPGECIAFVGPSGSGKSTIMNMIIGFLKATEGTLSIDGKPISELNLSDYRHFISVVPQNSILFTGTIRENITYGLKKVDPQVFDKVIELSNIKEFADKLPKGLDTVIGEHGDKLSGGQKQRICIARALIRNPKILILDEATSALDNISEYQVQKAINELIKDRTTFIVAHRLSTIRDADRIVVLDEGRCVECGTFDELMAKKGKFYELKTLSDLNGNKSEDITVD